MFFIVNKTRKNITISDIKVSLGPRQAIDLDKMMDRDRSDKSKDLKKAVNGGSISVKRKDGTPKIKQKEIKKSTDMDDLKSELVKEIREGIKEASKTLAKELSTSSPNVTVDDLTKVMKEVMATMPQASDSVVIREVERKMGQDEDVQLSDDILADIHTRAVNEMVREAKSGNVNYKEEKVEESIDSNISELEGLL